MAEQTEQVSGATATSSETTEAEELSLEAIAAEVQRGMYPHMQSFTDKAVDALRKELLPYLEEGKQTTALVKKLALGQVLSSEEMTAIEKAREDATERRALEEQNTQLKAQVTALQSRGLNEDQIGYYLDQQVIAGALELARGEGIITEKNDERAAQQLLDMGLHPKDRKTSRGDEYATIEFGKVWRANIRKAGDAKLKAETPKTEVPASRGNAAPASDLSGHELLTRAFANRNSS